jgi:hypothetical protein
VASASELDLGGAPRTATTTEQVRNDHEYDRYGTRGSDQGLLLVLDATLQVVLKRLEATFEVVFRDPALATVLAH